MQFVGAPWIRCRMETPWEKRFPSQHSLYEEEASQELQTALRNVIRKSQTLLCITARTFTMKNQEENHLTFHSEFKNTPSFWQYLIRIHRLHIKGHMWPSIPTTGIISPLRKVGLGHECFQITVFMKYNTLICISLPLTSLAGG